MKHSMTSNFYSQSEFEEKFKPLYQFFIDGLKDIYWAEKAIEEHLKKVKSLAHTEELMDAIEDHELTTHKHILRLEKIFQKLNMQAQGKKCEAIAGIIKEADDTINKTPEHSMTRDAVIIINAQKIEHYEIASYGGLLQIALTFDMEPIADLLEKNLNEEEETDLLLSDIAESFINLEASEEDEHELNEKDSSKDTSDDTEVNSKKTKSKSSSNE